MKGIELVNSTIGTVSSREDGSVAFRVITAELRPSERGVVMDYHGKACAVRIVPAEGAPPEVVTVDTERRVKSNSERLRAVHFLIWKQNPAGDFERFHASRMETLIEDAKKELPDR